MFVLLPIYYIFWYKFMFMLTLWLVETLGMYGLLDYNKLRPKPKNSINAHSSILGRER